MMKSFSCKAAGGVFAVVIGAAPSPAHAELVFNGSFETGNFLGWDVPPSVPNQSQFTVNPDSPHGGMYYAQLSSTSQQYISQTLPTQAGQDYLLSFWLRWDFLLGENLTVRWEGQPVLFVPGTAQGAPWTQFTVPLHANITGSFLEFGQNVFPGEWHVDDISVVPVPAPSAAAVLVLACGAVAVRRRRRGVGL